MTPLEHLLKQVEGHDAELAETLRRHITRTHLDPSKVVLPSLDSPPPLDMMATEMRISADMRATSINYSVGNSGGLWESSNALYPYKVTLELITTEKGLVALRNWINLGHPSW